MINPSELARLALYSLSGPRVLEKLYRLALDVIERNVPGDFVECGVYNGGSAAAVSCALRDTQRHIWLYDSFQGLPPPATVDGPLARAYVGECAGTEETVREAMHVAGLNVKGYTIRKGWFTETFQLPRPRAVSFLHVDADWYDSVMLALETFYDLVADGGVIVLDDFGHWEGCREAFYDFVHRKGAKPLLERFGHTQAFWIKGRAHNREFLGRWEIP
jgi:O-methyltransferase